MVSLAGIVLAAGLSTRMGRPKLLLELGNKSVIYRVVKAAAASQLDELVIVTGRHHDPLLQSLGELSRHPKLQTAYNETPEAGMASSIVAGMKSIMPRKRDGVMIILGDQAKLTKDVIDHLLAVFSESPSAIVAPTVDGRRTTPVIFPRRFFPALLSLSGDRGGRSILEANPGAVVRVELGNIYDDMDIDTLQDWEKMIACPTHD
jgi:molybdenum cofactor cytidylyltransferase